MLHSVSPNTPVAYNPKHATAPDAAAVPVLPTAVAVQQHSQSRKTVLPSRGTSSPRYSAVQTAVDLSQTSSQRQHTL